MLFKLKNDVTGLAQQLRVWSPASQLGHSVTLMVLELLKSGFCVLYKESVVTPDMIT